LNSIAEKKIYIVFFQERNTGQIESQQSV